jgi:hypothetical protein
MTNHQPGLVSDAGTISITSALTNCGPAEARGCPRFIHDAVRGPLTALDLDHSASTVRAVSATALQAPSTGFADLGVLRSDAAEGAVAGEADHWAFFARTGSTDT